MGVAEGQATGLTPSSNARNPVGEGNDKYVKKVLELDLSIPECTIFTDLEGHSAITS